MKDWYEVNIEPEVRETVKLLRNNGFNTTCSCGHKRFVQCDYSTDGEIKRLDDLLFNAGHRNYTINIYIERKDGWLHSFIHIEFQSSYYAKP